MHKRDIIVFIVSIFIIGSAWVYVVPYARHRASNSGPAPLQTGERIANTYFNSTSGMAFSYPTGFHVREEKLGDSLYKISVGGPDEQGFTVGTYAIGLESGHPSSIPDMRIRDHSGQFFVRSVMALNSEQMQVVASSDETQWWFISQPFSRGDSVALYDQIIQSMDINNHPE
jgi:hypothetical protein